MRCVLSLYIKPVVNVYNPDFTMDDFLNQRTCIKFCLKIGKNATETFELIKIVFKGNALSH